MGQGIDDVPALLFRGRDEGADDGEIAGPRFGAEATGDFLSELHHAGGLLGQVVREGDAGIGQETQHVVLTGAQSEQQVVAGAAPRTTPTPGDGQWRLGLMKGEPCGDDGVVSVLEPLREAGFQRPVAFAGHVGGMAGPTEQALHPQRPGFLLDLDQGLEFSQMMRIAQGMQHTFQGVVGLPVVVDDNANDPFQQTAPLRGNAVDAQPGGHRHMEPLRLATDAKAGFIQMLDRRGLDELTHRRHELLDLLDRLRAHPGDRGGGQFHPKQIGHQFDPPILGNELGVEQIDHEGRDPRAVLHRRRDSLGKRRPGRLTTLATAAGVGAMLGHDQRGWLGQVKDLPGAVRRGQVWGQGRTAVRAVIRVMLDNDIRFGHLTQRVAGMALLPAG